MSTPNTRRRRVGRVGRRVMRSAVPAAAIVALAVRTSRAALGAVSRRTVPANRGGLGVHPGSRGGRDLGQQRPARD